MLVLENRVRAADLNGLGIVAKERGLTIRYRSQGQSTLRTGIDHTLPIARSI